MSFNPWRLIIPAILITVVYVIFVLKKKSKKTDPQWLAKHREDKAKSASTSAPSEPNAEP